MTAETIAIVYLAVVFVVAGGVEIYKRFRTRAKDWEYRILAVVLSALMALVAYYGAPLPGTPVALIGYFALVYVGQYFVSLEVIKKIVASALKKGGVDV
jgi:uncharacterized membrane protein HdeD (DUF308 family)